jgi:superfamily II DNA or RNA helicase
MNEFRVQKLKGFYVTIEYSSSVYPYINTLTTENSVDQFTNELYQYKEFNLPITVPRPTTEDEVKKIVHDNDTLSMNLTTYQMFVRNFMSNYTPYNGMLLFHGLGTGKTCSAITISEEYRNYLKKSGKQKRIYVLSMSSAITENFEYQLFNETQLEQINNKWVCNSCVGDKFLQEIDPYQLVSMDKQTIYKLIKAQIDTYYVFSGCVGFANDFLSKIANKSEYNKTKIIQDAYEGSLFILDEIHNIKEDKDPKSFSSVLTTIVETTTIKILMMTATPAFNSCQDFVFLSKILNKNDKLPYIDDVKTIFNSNDDFVEGGEDVLNQHLHGYVSYVKGENPYSFPYRIYPNVKYTHPTNSDYHLKHLQIFPVILSEHQSKMYTDAVEVFKGQDLLGHNALQLTLIAYPDGNSKIGEAMKIDREEKGKLPTFSYKTSNHFFNHDQLKTYSAKLFQIQNLMSDFQGIGIIHVKQIKEGICPVAITLEALGYKLVDKQNHRTNLCSNYQKKDNGKNYIVLNPLLDINIQEMISIINDKSNMDGNKIKIVIITDALSEGVDFKNIRQMHIINPWWNLSQIEQIIGRAVRFRSHKELPFDQRNVEIFMYTAILFNNEETMDYYMYCESEKKGIKIGKLTRLLKEIAIDCTYNSLQTQSNESLNHLKVNQITSRGEKIQYPIGDSPYTVLTDYMETCTYTCKNIIHDTPGTKLTVDYVTSHIQSLVQRMKLLFNKNYIYTRQEIINELLMVVPEEKIDYTLSYMIDNKIPIYDRFNRQGYIVNSGEYYMFQPPELSENIPVYERRIPMAYVYDSILIDPGEKQIEKFSGNTIVDELKLLYDIANDSTKTTIRAQTPEDLVYSAFEALYIHLKRVSDFKDMTIEEWKQIKNSIYIDTIIERLSDIKCLELAKYLHGKQELTTFEEQLKEYFTKLNIKSKHVYLLWSNNDTVSYYNEKDWAYNISYSQEVLYQLPRENKDTILNNQLPLGGIAYNETYTNRVFKLSLPFTDKTTKQRYGFEITNKNDSKEILKELISDKIIIESQYTIKNIIWQIEFCLRYFDKQLYKGKRWFLNPVEVIQNNAKNFNLTKKPLKVKDKK